MDSAESGMPARTASFLRRSMTGILRNKSLGAANLLLIAICIWGTWERLRLFLQERPLWLDPAMLALNVLDKSACELFGPLDWNQSAPVGFLLLEKAVIVTLGERELALAAVPFVCAVASLLSLAFLSRRHLGPAVASIVTLPLAVSATAIYYAAEAKQYSGDLLAVVLLLWATAEAVRRKADSQSVGTFLAVSIFMTWLSHPSGLVMTAGWVSAWLALPQRSPERRRLMLAAFVALVHAALVTWFLARRTLASGVLDYHANSFPPWTGPIDLASWCFGLVAGYFRSPLHAGFALVPLVVCVVAGLLPERAGSTLGHSSVAPDSPQLSLRRVAWMTLGAAFLASAAHLYPLAAGGGVVASRFVLFTTPLVLVLMGLGLARVGGRSRGVALGLGIWILAGVGVAALEPVPVIREDMRALVRSLNESRVPTDRVFVYYFSLPAFDYYNRKFGVRHSRGTLDQDIGADLRGLVDADPRIERLWVVISHDYASASRTAAQALSSDFRRARDRSWSGAQLTLWRRRHAPFSDESEIGEKSVKSVLAEFPLKSAEKVPAERVPEKVPAEFPAGKSASRVSGRPSFQPAGRSQRRVLARVPAPRGPPSSPARAGSGGELIHSRPA